MFTKEAVPGIRATDHEIETQLMLLAEEIDGIEGYRSPHATFMARLAESLGAELGLHGHDLTALKFAALAHDLGERVMQRDYIERNGDLTWEERLDLWRHPILGEQAAAQRGLSRQAQLLIRWHHEWWNGSGYPDALAGEAIPLGARILRIVDTYSALLNDRPWRARSGQDDEGDPENSAQQIIADYAGIEFDPRVVQAFLHLLNKESGSKE